MPTPRVALALATAVLLVGGAPSAQPLPQVQPNDNREPAGTLRQDTLTLRLVVAMARWHPERPDGPFVDVPTFAEEGKAPQIPAPLIRVPTGTVLRVSVRNALPDSTLQIAGLASHTLDKIASESVTPGATRTFVFNAGTPGTYIYAASPGVVDSNVTEQQQLAGALIVDSAAVHAPDRVFVMNIWAQAGRPNAGGRNVLAINGRTWPWTETIKSVVGDTVQWRLVNATVRGHPMHMHGMYFRVDALGSRDADTTYGDARRLLAVTQQMQPWSTMRMTWAPVNPGNWLFHCHIAFHIAPENALDPAHDAMHGMHMVGLVLGIHATEAMTPGMPAASATARVQVEQGPRRGYAPETRWYDVQGAVGPPTAGSAVYPGTLVITRGVPTNVTVVNRMQEATAVHWHGLELDQSYSDGVPGWSGAGRKLAPDIQPGDSFVARLFAPRAGTFMDHAHQHDIEQLSSGLYAPLIVMEPGQRFDPATDHLFISGWDSPRGSPTVPPYLLINGDSVSSPVMYVAAGKSQRFRFINMGLAGGIRYTLQRENTPVAWQALAKDGADLPPALAVGGPAFTIVNVGETRDFSFTPAGAGRYRLTAGLPRLPPVWSQEIVVR